MTYVFNYDIVTIETQQEDIDVRDIYKELEYVTDLLSVLYDVPQITEVKISGHMTKTFGRCTTYRNNPNRITLTFAKFILYDDYPLNLMYNTIAHELLHAIDHNRSGHSGRWLMMAQEVSDVYNFLGNIQQYASSEKCKAQEAVKPQTTFKMYCCECGSLVGRKTSYRAPKWFTQGNNGHYRCNMCCGNKFRMVKE